MSENKYTPHVHSEAIKAWADGKPIEWRAGDLGTWKLTPNPGFVEDYQYRVKPEEVVDYTVVFGSGVPGANFQSTKEELWEYYLIEEGMQGFIKRTRIDGKVVAFEFIPKDAK